MKKRRSPAQVAATRRLVAYNASRRRGGAQTKAKRGCGCGGAKAKPTAPRRANVRRIILRPGQVVRVPVARRC